MIKLQIENYYITSPDRAQYQHDDEIAQFIDHRGTSFTSLYSQAAVWLGNLLVSWGSRLRQREGTWYAANKK